MSCAPPKSNVVTAISAVALNASDADDRTVIVDLGTQNKTNVLVLVQYTYSAATTVVCTPTISLDGTTYGAMTTQTQSGGAIARAVRVDTYTTGGASGNFALDFNVDAARKLKLVFSGASAGAGDLITVQAVAV